METAEPTVSEIKEDLVNGDRHPITDADSIDGDNPLDFFEAVHQGSDGKIIANYDLSFTMDTSPGEPNHFDIFEVKQ